MLTQHHYYAERFSVLWQPIATCHSIVACGGFVDYVQDAGRRECFVESGKPASEIARNVIQI